MYLTAYPFLSGAVHSSAGDLDQHFKVDAAGKVVALVTAPVLEGLAVLLLIISEVMVSMVRATGRVFPVSVLNDCEARLKALHGLEGERAG